MTKHNDPADYRAASVPHESDEVAALAAKAFAESVAELRKEYRMADVYLIASCNVTKTDADGPFEADLCYTCHFGHEENALTMIAQAYGVEMRNHEDRIARLRSAATYRKSTAKGRDSE